MLFSIACLVALASSFRLLAALAAADRPERQRAAYWLVLALVTAAVQA